MLCCAMSLLCYYFNVVLCYVMFMLCYGMLKPAVLNLWAAAHWWAVDLCLVGRDKGWELRIF